VPRYRSRAAVPGAARTRRVTPPIKRRTAVGDAEASSGGHSHLAREREVLAGTVGQLGCGEFADEVSGLVDRVRG
jgi:hypothetical protein